MNKNRLINTGIIVLGLFFILAQIVVSKRFSDFTGTDDKSVDVINEIAPDYQPWVQNMFDFTNEQSETFLFSLQGAIGMGIMVFYVVKQRHKRI